MNPTPVQKKLQEAHELLAKSNFSQALPLYEKLTRQFPRKVPLWFEYGCAACGEGKINLAERVWGQAVKLEPNNGQLMLQIGHQCQVRRFPEQARAWYERAVAANPGDINPRIALAMDLEQKYRFAEAREVIAACLAMDPKDDQARYFAAFLDRRENKIEEAERKLRDLLASGPRHQYVQYAARYELAEVLDRTERFDEAMQMLFEAKKLQQRLGNINVLLQEYDQITGYYIGSTLRLPKNILHTWRRQFPERARESRPRVAFLGGHPRSGTTLLENVLGAHPEVVAMDESPAFFSVACPLYHSSQQVTSGRLNIIRRRYLETIQREWGGSLEGKLLLDKNPSPTTRLRVWLHLFPELPVIISLRDPRDVVISCFFQNILLNMTNVNFLSLERTVSHYTHLMSIWLAVRQWEGLVWTETRYEDIVANVEQEGRRVTEFLGLKWDVGQGRFHEKTSQKRIYSPTYHDASKPVYSRSVARWHAYEKYLTPILPVLEPYCRALGYS